MLSGIKWAFLRHIEAKLTVTLAMGEFECTLFSYKGHLVGQGQIRPADPKVEAVANISTPSTRKQLMHFQE